MQTDPTLDIGPTDFKGDLLLSCHESHIEVRGNPLEIHNTRLHLKTHALVSQSLHPLLTDFKFASARIARSSSLPMALDMNLKANDTTVALKFPKRGSPVWCTRT